MRRRRFDPWVIGGLAFPGGAPLPVGQDMSLPAGLAGPALDLPAMDTNVRKNLVQLFLCHHLPPPASPNLLPAVP